MAKSKSFFGLRKGSTKSLTFSVLKGQQITKDRVTDIANPQTRAQMLVRVAFATVTQAAEKMLPIIGISWENIANVQESKQAFISANSKILRELAQRLSSDLPVRAVYAPKGNTQLIPNSYMISKGSLALPAPFQILTAGTSGGSFRDSSFAVPDAPNAVPLGTYTAAELWGEIFGLIAGDQITFPQIYGSGEAQTLRNGANELIDKTIFTQFVAPRVVLLSNAPTATITLAEGMSIESVRQFMLTAVDQSQSYMPVVNSMLQGVSIDEIIDDEVKFVFNTNFANMYTVQGEPNLRALGAILSRKFDDRWRYSTSYLCCVWDWLAENEGGDYYGFLIDNAIATYMNTVTRTADGNFLQTGGDDNIVPSSFM